MQIEAELAAFAPRQETVLTIGVFDGVHLGHQQLIDYLKRQALVRDYLPGVVTFRNHPVEVLSPQTRLPRLTSLEERIRLLHNLGIELVVPLSFTPEVAHLPSRDFVALLQKHLKMRGLVIGPDFALGRSREGDVSALHSLGKELGFWVDVIPPKIINGEVVSSTSIRQALAKGDTAKAKRLLGRPHALIGRVGHGAERGRQLGFPTANLEINSSQALPSDGVYATRAKVAGHSHPSVTNIGVRPTFGEGERTVEVYLIDFEGTFYGQELRLELIEHLRAEKRFPNPEELKAQISRDVQQARSILETQK
ncbi:MAG: bifunctional riboflavin kinase/FAD synthetase [Chloroflexi bacterium]|nr:bifunctional riboflavin kinase/FAD synthetase [Chloroflexota bacterium]